MYSKILLTPKSCPNCNKYFYTGAEEFCPKCGQKLEKEELTESNVFMIGISHNRGYDNSYIHYINKKNTINTEDGIKNEKALKDFITKHNDKLQVITLPNGDVLAFSLIHPVEQIKFECCRDEDSSIITVYFEFFYKKQYIAYSIELHTSYDALEGRNKEGLDAISILTQFSLEQYLMLPKANNENNGDTVAFYPYAVMQCMKSTLDKFKEEHPDEYNTIMLAEELKE